MLLLGESGLLRSAPAGPLSLGSGVVQRADQSSASLVPTAWVPP